MEWMPKETDQKAFRRMRPVAWRSALRFAMIAAPQRRATLNELGRPSTTLAWGRTFLPAHFAKPASTMHEWLGERLDTLQIERGTKINLIGPRGSAKSTIATLCYVLRAALEGWEPYIWIISDTKEQAHIHLENIKAELTDNSLLQRSYPESTGQGRHWRSASIQLSNHVTIDSYGTGQRIRGRRRSADRPSLIVCDDLQNDSHMCSAGQREASRQWFQGTLLERRHEATNIVNLATACIAKRWRSNCIARAGWTSRSFPAIESWPTNMRCGASGNRSTAMQRIADAKRAAREFYDRNRAQMDAGAVVLWPEVEDLYTLMQMRVESGHTAFEREKQGSPVNPELCEWPEPILRRAHLVRRLAG